MFRLATEQRLEVADESVYVSLAGGLGDDVLVVVVAEAAGQLFVVHLWLVFSDTPSAGDLIRIRHLELPTVAGPSNKVLATLVSEKLEQELPKLDRSAPGEAWT